MRQKFLIQRDDSDSVLTIKESANLDREYKVSEMIKLDKELFSLLGEETYDRKTMKSAIKKGKSDLILTLRTHNMYPIGIYAEKIAESVIELYDSKNNRSVEILFDDKEFLESRVKSVEESVGSEEPLKIDSLIEAKPAKDVPAKDAPAKDAPAKNVPAKGAPAKGAPAKGAPAKDVPAKDVPAKDVPAKDIIDKKQKKD